MEGLPSLTLLNMLLVIIAIPVQLYRAVRSCAMLTREKKRSCVIDSSSNNERTLMQSFKPKSTISSERTTAERFAYVDCLG